MGSGVLAFFFAIGASVWIFNYLQKTSGNNTRQSVTASGICFVILFVLFIFVFNIVNG